LSSITNLLMSSQFLTLLLLPVAAIALSIVIWKKSEKRFVLLAAGLWLRTIGVFAMAFPVWTPYQRGNMGGSGWSEVTRYLASLGVLGDLLIVLAIAILAVSALFQTSKSDN